MAPPKRPNPRIFISYSHDSLEHTRRVRALAERLRADGIDAQIDQYVQDPDEGWPKWMRTQVKEADKVLLVFTETYQRRFEGDEEAGKGLGATFEGVIVTQTLYESGGRNAKFRPVVFREEDKRFIPSELRRFNHYRVDTPDHYQDLLRWLLEAPRFVPQTLGQRPDLPPEAAPELFPGEQGRQVRTHVVDAFHRGDHLTISAALKAAAPGDRILVRPAVYKENLVINKPVEIIGDGDRERIVIEATQKHSVLFQATEGRIANLTLRQTGGGEWYCVDIAQGCLTLEACDITSNGKGGVAIHYRGAKPLLLHNHIHDCKRGGVDVYYYGQGTLEENYIYGNGLAGVAIWRGGNPTLRRNHIYDGKHEGVWVTDSGLGTLKDNDIYRNGLAGVAIRAGGNPTLSTNRIYDGEQEGVWVGDSGLGTVEDNDIFGNRVAGVAILRGGNPTLSNNRIHDGKQEGIWVGDDGKGTLEDNDIYCNAFAGVAIWRGGNPTLRRNHIYNGKKEGIFVRDGGRGVFTGDNNVHGNDGRDWDISEDCKDKVKRV